MNSLYKLTLLITMAVVTWKVWEIAAYLKHKKNCLKVNEKSNRYCQRQQTRKFLNSLSKEGLSDTEN